MYWACLPGEVMTGLQVAWEPSPSGPSTNLATGLRMYCENTSTCAEGPGAHTSKQPAAPRPAASATWCPSLARVRVGSVAAPFPAWSAVLKPPDPPPSPGSVSGPLLPPSPPGQQSQPPVPPPSPGLVSGPLLASLPPGQQIEQPPVPRQPPSSPALAPATPPLLAPPLICAPCGP